MSSIRVGIDGETQELLKKLEGIGSLDKAGVNNAIAEALRTGTVERFEQEQGPGGESWPRSIRASADGGLTLTRTGQLKSSIHARSGAAGAEVGTNLVYAATHQFGASGRTIRAKKKPFLKFQAGGRWIRKKQVTVNIPARPFLGVSDGDRQEIESIVEEAIAEA